MIGRVERVSLQTGCRLLDHRHASPHLLIVLAGTIVEDGVTYQAGDVRWSSARDRHFLRLSAAVTCLVIETTRGPAGAGTRRIVRDAELVSRLGLAPSDDRVRESLEATPRSWQHDEREAPAWLSELERRCDAGQFVRSPGVRVLARQAGVSREHLARQFRTHFGTTVTAALRHRRLREAYDRLRASVDPIVDVADACGFADQSHLTREMSHWIGLSPAAVRRITPVQDVPDAG